MHLPPAEDVQVQMADRLAAFVTGINNGTKSLAEAGFAGDFGCRRHQLSGERRVVFPQVGQRGNVLAWDYQQVRRRLRIQIGERNHVRVLMDQLGRNFSGSNLAEDAVHECPL